MPCADNGLVVIDADDGVARALQVRGNASAVLLAAKDRSKDSG